MPSYTSGTINIPSVTGNVVITAIAAAASVVSISAAFNPGQNTIYDTDTLEDLRQYLTVTAQYQGGSSGTVNGYTLSGTLAVGTSTITVSYSDCTTTFTVTVVQDISNIETVTTLTNGTDWNYASGQVDLTTGAVNENTGWYTSDLIAIPADSTSYSRVTSRESDYYLVWYDSNQTYIGNGGNGAYSGTGEYAGGYTTDGAVWNVIPTTAKYCRVSWRTNATYTSLTFKHNNKLKENTNIITDKVYYYTYANVDNYAANDDYLKCQGMAYVHLRPVIRRWVTFYDAEFIAVSTISTANNTGNNIPVPSNAVYMKCSNANVTATSASAVTIIGQRLVEFTTDSKESW